MAGTDINHPLQTPEWARFREKTGIKVIKLATGWQFTVHKLPSFGKFSVGHFARGPMPTKQMVEELKKLGRENNCIFIQLEPNVEVIQNSKIKNLGLRSSLYPHFHKYNFIIDLTKSEEELLAAMHPKTRYNIRVAQKHGVEVRQNSSEREFKTYLELYFKTIKRQHYFGHTPKYHQILWAILKNQKLNTKNQNLTAGILIAYYNPTHDPLLTTKPTTHNLYPIPIAAWMLFKLGDTLYYPYGGSSTEYRNAMASNLVAWEAIKLGKKLGCKNFDFWGALGPDASTKDPWYGFHKFKQGYGGRLVEYVGSYDLVLNPSLYWIFHLIDKLRWLLLRLR